MRTPEHAEFGSGSSSRSTRRRFCSLTVFLVVFVAFAAAGAWRAETPAVAQTAGASENASAVDSALKAIADAVDSPDEQTSEQDAASEAQPAAPIKTKDQMTFGEKMKRSFEKTFLVDGRWRLFLDGLKVTVFITILATILGTLLAFVQCLMRRSSLRILRYPAKVYIMLMQGTPILVVLLIMYYVVFTKLSLAGEVVAAIALGLNFAAYAGEQMRSSVDGIDKGLVEAARALGFGRSQVFWKIIFPIAARRIMPVYKGEFISLLKTTSIVGYVAIQDLTKASDIVRGRTYEAFFPLIATAIIYLVTAQVLAYVFTFYENWINPENRRRRAKGRVSV